MANYYDEYRNDLYDPDDGHDSVTPGLNANWKAIQKGFKAVEDDIDELTTRVEKAESAFEDIDNRLTSVETDLNNLETTVTELSDRVTTNEDNIANHANRLSQIETTLPILISRVAATESRINSLTDLIESIQDELAGAFSRITTLESTTSSHDNRITTLENSLTSLATRVQTLVSDVAIIKTEQTQQNSRLTSLENNVTQILNAINTLNTRMTNVESDLRNKQDVGNYVRLYQYSDNVDGLAIDYDVDESTDGTETTDNVNLGFKPNTSQEYGDMQIEGSGFGFGVGVSTRNGYKYFNIGKNNNLNLNHYLELNVLGDNDNNPFILDLDAVKTQTEKTIKQGTYMFTQTDGVNANDHARFNINVNVSGLEIGRQYLFIARVLEPSVPVADSVNLVYTLLTPVNTFAPSSTTVALPVSIMFQNLGSNPISLYNPRYTVNVIAIPI